MNRIIFFAPLALTACNSSPTVTARNASVAEVSNKVDAAVAGGQFVSPGRWETRVTIDDMTMPGLSPQLAQQMKAHIGQGGKTHVSCLTPAEAKRPKGDFFGAQKDCRYDHFDMGGGTIDAAMTCSAGGAMRTMTMKGTYSANSYTMAMTAAGGSAGGERGPMAGMAMKMHLDAKRTGTCTGKEDG